MAIHYRNKESYIFLLRILHGFFAIYFLTCLAYVYYCALMQVTNLLQVIAVLSLAIEGFLIFILNKGDCPLIHVQRRLGDSKSFFSLFFPERIAKRAIPYFAILTLIGFIFLGFRLNKFF